MSRAAIGDRLRRTQHTAHRLPAQNQRKLPEVRKTMNATNSRKPEQIELSTAETARLLHEKSNIL